MITDVCILKPRNEDEYNLIRDILLKRQDEQYEKGGERISIYNQDGSFNLNCFAWHSSKEGWSFWNNLSSRRDEYVKLNVEIAKMWSKEILQDIDLPKIIKKNNIYEIINSNKDKYFIKIEKE